MEGSAALLVLPYRRLQLSQAEVKTHGSPSAAWQEEQQLQPGNVGQEQEADAQLQATAAIMYCPLVKVPPPVAAELCGLMQSMEQMVGVAEETVTESGGADTRFTRARAFTYHFIALISDIVSLLLGCERLAEDFEGRETTGGANGAADVSVDAVQIAELQELGVSLVHYLQQEGLKATLRYLLQEVRNAGVRVLSGDLADEDAIRQLLDIGMDQEHKSPVAEARADSDGKQVLHRAPAAGIIQSVSESQQSMYGGAHPQLPVRERCQDGGSSGIPSVGKGTVLPTVREAASPALTAARWSSVFQGFDPPLEALFERYLYQHVTAVSHSLAAASSLLLPLTSMSAGLRTWLRTWLRRARLEANHLHGGPESSAVDGRGSCEGANPGALRRSWQGLRVAVCGVEGANGLSEGLPSSLLGLAAWAHHVLTSSLRYVIPVLHRKKPTVTCRGSDNLAGS